MSKIRVSAILVALTIVMATIPLSAACNNMAEGTRFVNDAAENILIAMNEGDYASFSKDFDDMMKTELTETAFPDFVSAINGSNGNYKAGSKKLNSTDIKEDEDLITASYLADFEDFEDISFEVTFKETDKGKKVVGLWFLGPSTNLFIGRTSSNF
jgi:major membrane immunogen (membrane-anchored lipoprotein)